MLLRVTDLARDHEVGAGGDEPHASYDFPRRLTASGRRAVQKAVDDFLADLTAGMDRHTQHAADLTDRDVHAALNELGRGRLRAETPPAGARTTGRPNTLAAALVTVGTVGVSVTGNFLHSALQIVVFVVLALIGLAGLTLTWAHPTSRPHSASGPANP